MRIIAGRDGGVRRTAALAIGIVAAVQVVLRVAPLVIQGLGGHGLPAPGTLNDPTQALATLKQSPDVPVVAGLICATGVAQIVVVMAVADRLREKAFQSARLSTIFGVISASFLLIDGALGMTALPQLAQLDPRQDMVDGAYLAILGIRDGIDRVIPLALGIWSLAVHLPACRQRLLPRPLPALGLPLGIAGVAGAAFPTAGSVSLALAVLWTAAFAGLQIYEGTHRPIPEGAVQRTGRWV